MPLSDLLIACASGEMPMVRHAEYGVGKVVEIIDCGHHQGCTVEFPAKIDFFYESATFTGEKMSELTLATDNRKDIACHCPKCGTGVRDVEIAPNDPYKYQCPKCEHIFELLATDGREGV